MFGRNKKYKEADKSPAPCKPEHHVYLFNSTDLGYTFTCLKCGEQLHFAASDKRNKSSNPFK